jgi:ketol-acid reductoisomerase
MLIPSGNYNFFEDYKIKKTEIIEEWKVIVNYLYPKSIAQLISQHSNIMTMLNNQEAKMTTVQNLVSKLLERST